MAHRQSFYVYKRKKTNGSYWYVCYLDRETGKQMSAKSIDCLKEKLGIMDFCSVTRKEEAIRIAQMALDKDIVFSDTRISFLEFCREYWDYDNSEYIRMCNAMNIRSIGREYAYNMLKSFNKHVVPVLPKNLKLQDVNVKVLDKVMKSLVLKGLSNGTVQFILYSVSNPLKEAVRLGYLKENPCDKLLRVSRSERNRGALTVGEIFKLRSTLEEMRPQMFPSYYLGILLALVSGMRCGEIIALSKEDITESSKDGYKKILIRHSVAYFTGLKGTKSNYERSFLAPDSLVELLLVNANEDGVLLPSPQKTKTYMSEASLRSAFYEVLEHMGIDEETRKERDLTFHSLRHSFSTLSRDENISQEDRMLVLGHRSKEINDRYTHSSEEALAHVAVLTDKLFSGVFPSSSGAEKGVAAAQIEEDKCKM